MTFHDNNYYLSSVLFCSAADSFDASYQSGILVYSDGTAEQIPPGMFKSTCHINIRWFPFDKQECEMKFGSWTYDGTKIDLQFLDGIPEGSMKGFATNGEWDLEGMLFNINHCEYQPNLGVHVLKIEWSYTILRVHYRVQCIRNAFHSKIVF